MVLGTTITETDGGVVTVAFSGELDISRADEVERELERLESGKPTTLVFDLRELEFLDSTGLRIILGADSRARREGRRVAIVPGPEKVHRVFRITLLDRRLDFADTPEAAAGNVDAGD
jgi:anti-sigma B factor antagonist